MALKAIIESLDEIDERFHELYTEKGGKFEFTGVEGFKTQADIDRLQTALSKERNEHRIARDRMSLFGDRKPEDILAALDRIPELEAAAAGKLDDSKLNEIVETRIKSRIAPLEREKGTLSQTVAQLTESLTAYQQREIQRSVHDEIRKAATTAHLLPEALEDALMFAERVFEVDETGRVQVRDGFGFTPGTDATTWFSELQSKRPHWWGSSQGGGATGSKGNLSGVSNPWSLAHWNMTEQGKIYKENRQRAESLAKSAGTTIGGPKPRK